MTERITTETAYPTSGSGFQVEVRRVSGQPPTIYCDGEGRDCPFKGTFHCATTCALDLESNGGGINLCGKAELQETDCDDDV